MLSMGSLRMLIDCAEFKYDVLNIIIYIFVILYLTTVTMQPQKNNDF